MTPDSYKDASPLNDEELRGVLKDHDHDYRVRLLVAEVQRHRKAIDEVIASIMATRTENPIAAPLSDWLGHLRAILTKP